MAICRGNFDCLGQSRDQYSVYCTVWMVQCSHPCREENFSVLQNDQTHPGSHPTLHLRGNRAPFRDYSSWGVMITTDVHLMLRLQWSYTLLPLHDFTMWVYRLAMGWTVWGLNSGVGTRFSAVVHAAPGPHLASCTMGTLFLSRGRAARARPSWPVLIWILGA